MKRNYKNKHNWTREDHILAYYYATHGEGGLQVSCSEDLANFVIGSSLRSLEMQASNFRYLLDIDGPQLTDFSEVQAIVAADLKGVTRIQLRNMCNEIIFNSDMTTKISEKNMREHEKKREEFKQQSEERLQQELKRHAMFGRRLRPLNKTTVF